MLTLHWHLILRLKMCHVLFHFVYEIAHVKLIERLRIMSVVALIPPAMSNYHSKQENCDVLSARVVMRVY